MSVAPIGELLELTRRRVEVDPLSMYTEIGIRSFGRGVFHKTPVPGAELGEKRVFWVEPGDLILNNVFAWEGAVAVAEANEAGTIGSHRFMTYIPRDDVVDVSYLRHFFVSEEGRRLLGRASPGSAGRNRTLAIDRFESLEIPLPDIVDQRRIAARLDSLLGAARDVQRGSERASSARVVEVLPGIVEQVLSRHASRSRPLGGLVDFVNDLIRPGDAAGAAESFVGLQHIEQHTGRRVGSLPLGDEKGRKFRFRPGDVLYGYLRPYQNKVWLADRDGLCSVEQYVLRTRGDVPPAYIAHALRSRAVLREAIRLTHNLQLPRLRSGLLAKIEIPVLHDGYERVLADLDSMQSHVLAIADRARERTVRLEALEPTILNHAFAGKL